MDLNSQEGRELLEAIREQTEELRQLGQRFGTSSQSYYEEATRLMREWNDRREIQERTYEARYRDGKAFQRAIIVVHLWYLAISVLVLRFLFVNW